MVCIVAIVEGHGEVEAVPVLLRRIAEESGRGEVLDVPRPIRVGRQRLLKVGELERTVELAARQSGRDGGILVLLDADRDCPKDLAEQILRRATAARRDRTIRVVLAKREFESWFVAAAASIAGERGLPPGLAAPAYPEQMNDPKGWLSAHMGPGRSYRETLDQPALASRMDLAEGRRARSFDKLWRDVASLLR